MKKTKHSGVVNLSSSSSSSWNSGSSDANVSSEVEEAPPPRKEKKESKKKRFHQISLEGFPIYAESASWVKANPQSEHHYGGGFAAYEATKNTMRKEKEKAKNRNSGDTGGGVKLDSTMVDMPPPGALCGCDCLSAGAKAHMRASIDCHGNSSTMANTNISGCISTSSPSAATKSQYMAISASSSTEVMTDGAKSLEASIANTKAHLAASASASASAVVNPAHVTPIAFSWENMEAKWEGYPHTYSHTAPAPAGPITQHSKKVPSASAFASENTTRANSAGKKVKPILKTGTHNMCGTVFLNASSGGEYKVGFPVEVVSDERGIWVGEAKRALKKTKVDEKRANKERKEKKENKYRIMKKKEKSSSSSSSSSISDSDSDSDSDASHTRRELEKLRRKLKKLKGEVGQGKTFRVVGGGGDMFTHTTRATSEGVHAQGGLDINGTGSLVGTGTGWELENANTNMNLYGSLGYAGGHARMSVGAKEDEDAESISATGKAKSKARTGRLWDDMLPLGAASMNAGIGGAGSAEVDASATAQALINTVNYGHRVPPPSISVPPPIQSEGRTGTNVDANIYTYHAESSEKSTEANGNPPVVPPKIHWQHYQNSREKSDQELQHILIDEESSHPCGGGIIPSSGVFNTHGPCTSITDTNGGGDARIQSQEQHHVHNYNYNHNHLPAPPQLTIASPYSTPQLLSCIQYSAFHSHSQEDYAQQQHSYQCTNPHTHPHTHTHNPPSEADGHTHTDAHGCHDHGHGFCSYTYTLPEGWNTVQVTTMTSWTPVAPVAVMWGGWGWGLGDWYAP